MKRRRIKSFARIRHRVLDLWVDIVGARLTQSGRAFAVVGTNGDLRERLFLIDGDQLGFDIGFTERDALFETLIALEAARIKRLNARAKVRKEDDRAFVPELDEEESESAESEMDDEDIAAD